MQDTVALAGVALMLHLMVAGWATWNTHAPQTSPPYKPLYAVSVRAVIVAMLVAAAWQGVREYQALAPGGIHPVTLLEIIIVLAIILIVTVCIASSMPNPGAGLPKMNSAQFAKVQQAMLDLKTWMGTNLPKLIGEDLDEVTDEELRRMLNELRAIRDGVSDIPLEGGAGGPAATAALGELSDKVKPAWEKLRERLIRLLEDETLPPAERAFIQELIERGDQIASDIEEGD